MRRHLARAALAALSSLHGCGTSEPEVENVCAWLGDPENCYRAFAADVGSRCGAAGRGNAPKGGFGGRDKLDVCVLSPPVGGQVLFDPPLDLKAFPLTSASFKLVSSDGLSCGNGSWSGPYSYSISVNPYPPDGGAPGTSEGEPVSGGTFSSTNPEGRQLFDVACPDGQAYHFDRLQTTKCEKYAGLVPRAELESSAGAIDVPGFVRFRVYYPPTAGALEGAEPTVVEYFDCSFAGAPPLCADGAQNGTETDVDCGRDCATKCQEGQSCIEGADCASGNCAVNAMGLKKCAPATTNAGGAGGG